MPNNADSMFSLMRPALMMDPDSIVKDAPSQPACPADKVEPQPGACQPLPYPRPEAKEKNEHYAKLIRSSFCGGNSELTAVMAYFYHSLRFCECSKELSDALLGISRCEMIHLSLLGRLLCSLGGDPKFFCCLPPNANPGGWWSAKPSVVPYSRDLGEALLNDIKLEEGAIEEYQSAAGYIDDEHIQALINRILLDERGHLLLFKSLYQRFCS